VGAYRGAADSDLAFALVFAIGFAVTSIPVISRIFIDLGVMDTRFARLVLTTATIEDLVLWVALSVALAVAADAAIDGGHLVAAAATTLGFLALSLLFGPRLVMRLAQHRRNALATAAPVAFLVLVCFAFAGVATLVDVNPMFGALIAGIVVGRLRGSHFDDARERVRSVGLATLVPLYFALVGFELDLTAHFDLALVLALFAGSSAVKMVSVWLGAHAAGCSRRAGLNLALAMNARGGPGIVLGSLAYEAGIVDGRLFVALIATALLTSVLSGAWLRHALERGEGSVDDALLPPIDLGPGCDTLSPRRLG
ncbi:MAG: cation:proton antiporter, partial [Gammaproteobacteria bacterium]